MKAATSDAACAGCTGALSVYGPPPGLMEPEYSCAPSRRVSIHASPAGAVPPGGTRFVSYTAGIPATLRPTGAHTPSPAEAGVAKGARGAGTGRAESCGGAVVVVVDVGGGGAVVVVDVENDGADVVVALVVTVVDAPGRDTAGPTAAGRLGAAQAASTSAQAASAGPTTRVAGPGRFAAGR